MINVFTGKKALVYMLASLLICSNLFGSAQGDTYRIYFIHLSTGENWLNSNWGGLRAAVNGAVTPDGHSYRMRDSHTGNADQREWPDRFNRNKDWQRHDIVMFKSCFPASHIYNKRLLKEFKKVYKKKMARIFRQHGEILFIIVTAPPLVPNETDQKSADRARKFNNWLKRKYVRKYNSDNPGFNNVAVFDLFDVLANSSNPDRNMLKKSYRLGPWDSHPDKSGCRKATEEFIPILMTATDAWAASK